MAYVYEVGDIVRLKKKHPCGSFEWHAVHGKIFCKMLAQAGDLWYHTKL